MTIRDVSAALTEFGGVASRGELLSSVTEGWLRAALRAGVVGRVGRGMYALTSVADAPAVERSWVERSPTEAEVLHLARARALARAHCAVLSHRAAAAQHGWPVFEAADRLDMLVPAGRRARPFPGVRRRRGAVTPEEHRTFVTSPLRTVIDCAVELPLPEAVAVADAALRSGKVGPQSLLQAAARYQGRHARRVRRVAELADPGADNPFESVVRTHLSQVGGLRLVTQHKIADGAFHARVDIADVERRIVVEADSHRYHGSREAFARDVTRYTGLVVRGWTVLRFTVADARAGEPVREAAAALLEEQRRGRPTLEARTERAHLAECAGRAGAPDLGDRRRRGDGRRRDGSVPFGAAVSGP